jgi:ribosomal subunit interface protein
MQVQISGKHVDVGEALRARVSDEITLSIGKYFDRGGDAEVVISKEGYAFRVDCSVKLASGQQLISHGSGGDAHAAFDAALAKIETRIRRYKRRLKSHSPPPRPSRPRTRPCTCCGRRKATRRRDDWEREDDHPRARPRHDHRRNPGLAEDMTVSMAVMELDLTESQAIVFRNAAHDGLSVVYRRPDGNIGWIDPERTKSLNGHAPAAS